MQDWSMGGWETAVVAEASLTLVAVARLLQTDVVAALAPLAEGSTHTHRDTHIETHTHMHTCTHMHTHTIIRMYAHAHAYPPRLKRTHYELHT